jgi:glycerol-3-phosphate dehydrogenase
MTKIPNANLSKTAGIGTVEEIVQGQRLSEIINTRHENVKYLPGIKLPLNIKAIPSLVQTVKDATLLVFVFPHQYVTSVCEQIKSELHPKARAISLIKVGSASVLLLYLKSDSLLNDSILERVWTHRQARESVWSLI